MAYKKLISVEQKHIDEGRRGRCRDCPVAPAVKEAFGAVEGWASDTYVGYRSYMSTAFISSKTTRSVYRFFSRFDKGLPVKPFKFWFDPC